jgi:hypothetical protein
MFQRHCPNALRTHINARASAYGFPNCDADAHHRDSATLPAASTVNLSLNPSVTAHALAAHIMPRMLTHDSAPVGGMGASEDVCANERQGI